MIMGRIAEVDMSEKLGGEFNVRSITYSSPRIVDHTLDQNLPALRAPTERCRKRRYAQTSLGTLSKLPLEILHTTLRQLDLRSLTDLRRVNQQATLLVDMIPVYQAILRHAHSAIQGILSIGTGGWITCDLLHEKLCTAECEDCGDFGGFLYLLTCQRVCFLCFTENKKYLPLRHSHAKRKFGLSRQELGTLPRMRSIPGVYAPNSRIVRASINLVDAESACRAGIAIHGSVSAMEQYVSDIAARKSSTSQRSRSPRPREPFDGQSGNPVRFMAIVRLPWLNRGNGQIEQGFHCSGCRKCYHCRPLHWRRKFTIEKFSDHIRECGPIRHGNTISFHSPGYSKVSSG